MADAVEFYVGDTLFPYREQLLDDQGVAFSIPVGATVYLRFSVEGAETSLWEVEGTVEANSVVRHDWSDAEVATAGRYQAQWFIVTADNPAKTGHWPPRDIEFIASLPAVPAP